MILGCTEQLFDELLTLNRKFSRALVALIEETDVEKFLPARERQYLQRALEAYIPLRRKMIDLIHPVKTELAQNFWKGFALALQIADREELLAEYPDAQAAAALVEAECLLMMSDTPPPVE